MDGDRKIVDYVVESGHSNISLSANVQKWIKKGWQPYGDPYLGHEGHCQAMAKYEPLTVELSLSKFKHEAPTAKTPPV